jgi:preprotein translocase SecE subunit
VATKNKTTKKSSSSTVVRVTAQDEAPGAKKVVKKTKATAPAKAAPTVETETKNPFRAIAGYFVGAWQELKQVRWPNRQATWGMTLALLAFTAFFVALILLLDALFKYIFQLILG